MSNKKKLTIKRLESRLQDLDGFNEPKIQLEQYATPPHIAATLLNTIDTTFNDLQGKVVADLGCGTGRLAVGSVLCGAQMVFGFDIDREALQIGVTNVGELLGDEDDDSSDETNDSCAIAYRGCNNFQLIQADIASIDCDKFWEPWRGFFDTVIMNPPFGTKQNVGLDLKFLKRAIDISNGSVYSLHKTTTRSFISGKAEHWGVLAKPVAQIRYNLENTYKFHKRNSVDIDVDLWQIKCNY